MRQDEMAFPGKKKKRLHFIGSGVSSGESVTVKWVIEKIGLVCS